MQEAIVAAAVAWAAFVVASRYAPRAVKQRMRAALSHAAGRLGWNIPLLSSTVDSDASACGGCNGCGSKATPGAQAIAVDALRRTARRNAP